MYRFTLALVALLGLGAIVIAEDYRVRIREGGQLLELSCNIATATKAFNVAGWTVKHKTIYGRDEAHTTTVEVYERESAPANLKWIAANRTCLPQQNPVFGGNDETGAPIYICQFSNNITHYLGWVSPKDGICTSADHDDYRKADTYELLTNPHNLAVKWIPVDAAEYKYTNPPGAVVALAGTKGQFIGRVERGVNRSTSAGYLIGKIFPAPYRHYLEELEYVTTAKGSLEMLVVQ